MTESHPDIEAGLLPFDASSSTWSDVTPTFQDDGPADALCQIMYDPAYSSAMDIFRTLYPKKEYSARALALTTHLVKLCPSNYSIWSYRADILIDGSQDKLGDKAKRLQGELDWMEATTKDNLKSYQVWQHRRLILSALSASNNTNTIDISRELAFISSVLGKDSKNYHTWAYRQWILCQYASSSEPDHEVWKSELRYTDTLLKDDGRNNSAWNHRFFLLFGSQRAAKYGASQCGLSSSNDVFGIEECIRLEVAFIKTHISLTPSNIAPFVYLRGILQQTTDTPLPLDSFSLQSSMMNLLPKGALEGNNTTESRLPVPVLEYLLDIAIEKNAASLQLIDLLAAQDPIRKAWWEHKKTEVAV
ncbi:unnamed protein product [Sympodiomycopsis kandeliae]